MHPVFYHIGSFYIGTYGVLLALALVLGTLAALGAAKRVGVPGQTVMDLIFYGVLGGIAGGRLAHILVNFREFLDGPAAVLFARTGFVFIGSFIGSAGVVVFIVRRQKLNFWQVADVLITAVPLGHTFGRFGCFMAGCCFGRPLAEGSFFAFLGVRFPRAVQIGNDYIGGQAFFEHYQAGLLAPGALESLAVWPVQLFESFGNLLVFLVLLWTWRRRRRFHGQVFLLYLALYSVMRFGLEFLRGDTARGAIGVFTTSQALCLLSVFFVLAAWVPLRRTRAAGRLKTRGVNDK